MQSARIWREIPQRYRLEAGRCAGCGKVYYPPRRVCAECHGREFENVRLPPTGKVATFTVIRVAAANFVSQIPMIVGIVELDDGTRIMCQVVDVEVEDVDIGMPVRLEFRKIQQDGVSGVISYGHKAVPA